MYLEKNRMSISVLMSNTLFATIPIMMFKKSTLSNTHHRKTYMYINFQQSWVSRSVKNNYIHTNLFPKKSQIA